jgi:prepilin-type processing-associated H-X9-DG protein
MYDKALAAIQYPSETYVIGDSIWIDSWPNPATESYPPPAPWNPQTGNSANINSSAFGRIVLNRHLDGVNVCFADGHAKWSTMQGLYQLKYR